MKKGTIPSILFGISSILLFTNCSSDPNVDGPTISIDKKSITLDSDGNEQTISVSSNTSWGTECDSWLTCSPSSGTGGRNVTIYAYKNTGDERSTNLTFYDTKTRQTKIVVRVTQKKADSPTPTPTPTQDPALTVEPISLDFTSSAGSNTFTIESNTSWTVKSDQDWCTVNTASGTNNATVTVNVTENTSNIARDATITVGYDMTNTSDVESISVKVIQEGVEGEIPGDDDNQTPVAPVRK